jgi:predicted ATPase
MTVVVGANASGKTVLLKAITGWIEGHAVWRRDGALRLTVARRPDPAPSARYLDLDVRQMREKRDVEENAELAPDGWNLVNVYATLPRRTREELSGSMCALVPALRDVDVRPGPTGKHRLVFEDRWQPGLWYEADEVSDGTIVTLALLVLQHEPQPAGLIALDTPERGLHPYLIGEIVGVLRKMSRGEHGRPPVQIVIATQSSDLLEHVEPEEVRFLKRDREDGSVTIEEAPTGTPDWRETYEAHLRSLGGMWLSGSLGGVPTG